VIGEKITGKPSQPTGCKASTEVGERAARKLSDLALIGG
jgi:hypothetical protein